MFEKFGRFKSAEELNAAAEGFAMEGDIESLRALAEENGIDPGNVDDYLEQEAEELATPVEAAIGRLRAQKDVPPVLVDIACGMAAEDGDFAFAVMEKGKDLAELFKALKDAARKEARKKFSSGETMASVCETDREKEKLLRTFYLGTKEDLAADIRVIVEGGNYESV